MRPEKPLKQCRTSPRTPGRMFVETAKFRVRRSDVFRAAAGKLSAEFFQDLRVCSLEAEKAAMLKEDFVEQHTRGRCTVRAEAC